jgi:uncharacterized hydrophobic protein (TIGR00271 family)
VVFATGWLILGGYICVGGLLTHAIVNRLSLSLKLVFDVNLEVYSLVMAVIGLSYVSSVVALHGSWRRRTILVWSAVLVLLGILTWSYIHHPPVRQEVPGRQAFRHWLTEVALLAGGLWYIDLVLQHREQFKRPNRTVFRGLLIVWTSATVLASVAALMVLRYPGLQMQNWMGKLSWAENRLELLILLTGILVCWIGLSRVLASGVRLTDAMTRDGFLPQWLEAVRDRLKGPFLPLTFFAAMIALVAIKAPVPPVIGMAALTFLWTTVIVITPHARRSAKDLPRTRRLKLPLHPLLPALAVGTGLFFSWILPRPSLVCACGWLVLGALYFLVYAQRGHVAAQRRDFMMGDEEAGPAEGPYRVLVNIAHDSTAPSVIKAGAGLAMAQNGELLILHVLPLDESAPVYEMRETAEWEWLRLERRLQSARELGVPVRLLTRVAPSPAAGILSTAAEYNARFILLDWPDKSAETDDEAFTESVFQRTSLPVGILRGTVPESVNNVLVADAGGPNVPIAVEIGEAIARAGGGKVELLTIVRPSASAKSTSPSPSDAPEKAELPTDVEQTVIEAANIKEAIMAESDACDILLIGASVDPLLNQAVLGGLPAEIAQARSLPTMVVKRAERHRSFWMQRGWGLLSQLLPTLTVRERAEVFAEMWRSARANVDFYAMMCLASGIAVLGLALNSGAVIIGAMLVAPLMSPMMAIAQGIVLGRLTMIRKGVDSTLKGVGVAIAVGTGITLVIPSSQPTYEILARTEPSVIDLMVALVSGAAGAYAISRKWVAAALPGVAISAALVPPLCVVGYGLASSRFPIAGGALLLFMTNLSAIVLVSVIVFLLVGFRPMRTERARVVTHALLVSIVFIIALSIPLGFKTRRSVRMSKLDVKLDRLIHEAEEKNKLRIEDLSIEEDEGAYVVSATIYAYKELPLNYVKKVGQHLAEELGVPVRISATVVQARLAETSSQ